MKFENNNGILTFHFEGMINSDNAQNVEKEVDDILSYNKSSKQILDFKDLEYVSSAGLRIILKLRKRFENLEIINVSLEIYDILQMTGFTEIVKVSRAINEVDISGATIVGEGYFSTVYRINKDTIIKVFNRTSDEDQIERELTRAKQAFVLGIPTAISFDIVKVGDKLGVRFEMLDCKSLRDCLRDDKEKYDEFIRRYASLIKKINTTICESKDVPSMNKAYLDKLNALKPHLDNKLYDKLYKMISSVKETSTFVHGDCHMKNIMVQGDELLLIDMDTLSVGHPIYELAQLYASHIAFEEEDPGNTIRFFGLDANFVRKIFDDVMNLYFDSFNEDILNKIRIVCYIHMAWWNLVNVSDDLRWFNGSLKKLTELLDKYDNLEIGI